MKQIAEKRCHIGQKTPSISTDCARIPDVQKKEKINHAHRNPTTCA
jgi:hypothetical protein